MSSTSPGTRATGSRRDDRGELDTYELILWIFLGGLIMYGAKEAYSRWAATNGDPTERASSWLEQLTGWLVPAAIVAAVAAGMLWGWRRLRDRRRYLVAQYAAAVKPAMPSGFDPADDLRVTRWRGVRPRRITVDLSPACPDNDPAWRTQLVDLVRKRTGEQLAARWPGSGGLRSLVRERRRVVLAAAGTGLARRIAAAERGSAGDDAVDIGDVDGELASDKLHTALGMLVPAVRVVITRKTDEGTPAALRISYGETTRDMSPNWRARVIGQVTNRLGGAWRAPRWDTANRAVTLELIPPLPHPVPWKGPQLPASEHPVLPYGIDEDGFTVAWELGPKQPHGAVVGPTGTGKSETMNSIAGSALMQGVMLAVIAPKPEDFVGLLGMPGVAFVATEVSDRAHAIKALHAQMKRRLAARGVTQLEHVRPDLARERPASAALDDTHLLIIIDEQTQLVDDFDRWWNALPKTCGAEEDTHSEDRDCCRVMIGGTDSRVCPFTGMLREVAQLSRSAGLNGLFGMQRPDAMNFGKSTQMRDNLPHRVSMGEMSAIGSDQQWGDRETGRIPAENPGEGVSNASRLDAQGRIVRTGVPGRFKAVYLDEQTLLSDEFRTKVAQVAPDTSLLDLGDVSPVSRSIEAALAQLRRAAGFSDTASPLGGDPDGTPASTRPAEQRVELAQRAEAASDPAAVRDLSGDPEVDAAGRVWDEVAVSELAEGDVIALEEVESARVLEAGWVEDEFTAEPVFRLTVETDDGDESEWDMDPEDAVHRMTTDDGPAAP